MSWHFQALHIIYPILFSVSVTIIALLSRWIDRTPETYPADLYYTFVLAGLSFLLATSLCIQKLISCIYEFRPFIIFMEGLLMVAWLTDAILIVVKTRMDNESTMDNEATRIRIAIMSLAWVQFVILDLMLVIKLSAQQRRRRHSKYSDTRSLGSQSDARELESDDTNYHEKLYDNQQPPTIQSGNATNVNNDNDNDINDKNGDNDNQTNDTKNNDGEIYAEARYDFKGSDFSFKVGDKVRITKKSNNAKDWWKGEINGKKGEKCQWPSAGCRAALRPSMAFLACAAAASVASADSGTSQKN
ncbi:12313_t:CDS:2 [Ambispora gerdemannii]|uniref:12313_t:CDS:1 n=1 Tax=Ambispora gerdemannii TaxID=144530 RepID=A0A9N9F4P6_9GLOM|nr:12313_t:CDS:2 [Ambispora gerdemannii]